LIRCNVAHDRVPEATENRLIGTSLKGPIGRAQWLCRAPQLPSRCKLRRRRKQRRAVDPDGRIAHAGGSKDIALPVGVVTALRPSSIPVTLGKMWHDLLGEQLERLPQLIRREIRHLHSHDDLGWIERVANTGNLLARQSRIADDVAGCHQFVLCHLRVSNEASGIGLQRPFTLRRLTAVDTEQSVSAD
jgi:hypothetical protein